MSPSRCPPHFQDGLHPLHDRLAEILDMIWNMTWRTAGGTELMATYVKLSFQQFKMGYGSSVAAGMFILITLIALFFQKIFVVKEND